MFTSCLKDDDSVPNNQQEELLTRKKRIDSTLRSQEPILRAYALENFSYPVYDDSTGIWYEILSLPENSSYTYTVTESGQWITPVATVKYKGILLNGNAVDEVNDPKEIFIQDGGTTQRGLIPAIPIAFRPEKVTFRGQDIHTGLIPGGLQKGHKIRFVAPSPFCYDDVAIRNAEGVIMIPKDSPLDYTIEVINIR